MKIRFFLVMFAILLTMTACTFKIKTPVTADYQKMDIFPLNKMVRNDLEVALGSPQGRGIHYIHENEHDLTFYFGFAGTATLSSLNYDSGTAFITYENEKPLNILYFTSRISDQGIPIGKDLATGKLLKELKIGQTRVADIYAYLGNPYYTGKRVDNYNGIYHNIAFYDVSVLANDGAVKEKWILIGYDEKNVVQDLIWVSSSPQDIRELGSIEPQQFKQLSRMTVAGFIPMLEPQSLSTSTKIDPVQVEALLKTKPKKIGDFLKVLGKPTALGIKSFAGEPPMILSNYSFSKVELKGNEHNYIPPSASEEQRKKLSSGESYMVMDITQSRLMVGHDNEGNIKEIIWVKPWK